MKSTARPVSSATEKSFPVNLDSTAQGAPDSPALRLADVPTGGIQLRIPHLRFDAPRGCDRIRRRIYADPRIRPSVAFALVALSEFADVRFKAWPKQDLLAAMLHTKRQRIGEWLSEAEALGVLVKDRNRPGGRCCYTFAETWLQWFRDDGTDVAQKHARRASRSTRGVHPEAREACISTEPCTRTEQQQQQGCEVVDEDTPARPVVGPSPAQLRGITDMSKELHEDAPAVETRAEASEVFRNLKRRVATRRGKSSRDAYVARQEYRDYAGRLREMRRQAAGDR